LINNRQTGRRRGRGGGPRSPNQPSPGNRQENRSRGNAAQLLEKYKSLARDAQLQGDRVQSESYLQFAEHYFRVLNESRARFEEQRRQRGDYYSEEDEEQDEAAAAPEDGDGEDRDGREERDEREERFERQPRADRPERADRPDRGDPRRREFREERNGERRPERQRARGQDWSPREERQEPDAEERISLDVLPPAISPEGDAPAKAPRRRTRRPRGEGEAGEVDLPPAA
jgi:Domain of unknown function (DUF4167)